MSGTARLLAGVAWVVALALSAIVLLIACGGSGPTATPSGSPGPSASPAVSLPPSALPSPSGPPATLAELLDSQGLRDPESGTILAKPVKRETVALDELTKRIEADPAWLAARDTATSLGFDDARYALAVT